MLNLASYGRTEPIFSRPPRSRAWSATATIPITKAPASSFRRLRKEDLTEGRKAHSAAFCLNSRSTGMFSLSAERFIRASSAGAKDTLNRVRVIPLAAEIRKFDRSRSRRGNVVAFATLQDDSCLLRRTILDDLTNGGDQDPEFSAGLACRDLH
jgi:hypothetical protein